MGSFLIFSRACLANMIEGVKTFVAGKASAEHTGVERAGFSADATETNNIVHVLFLAHLYKFFSKDWQ